MPSRRFYAAARLRSLGGRLVRRLGLVPGGEPDGLGEDDTLGGAVLDQRVVAFFPEPPGNGYQLEQWLRPAGRAGPRHGVADRHPGQPDRRAAARAHPAAGAVRRAHGHAGGAGPAALDRAGALRQPPPAELPVPAVPELAHVYLGHGESDKAVSASNQLKAYDRVFVAGQAAEERVLAHLMWFDRNRTGADRTTAVPDRAGHDTGDWRPTVLYAPTWEGAQASMAYSSVLSHGVPLVRSLLAEGLRVVYRPHPRTGANSVDVRAADAALRAVFVEDAVRRGASVVDTTAPLEAAFADADVLVTDVSSVAVEWLPTGRPLVVTVPADPCAVVAGSPLLEAVPRLAVAEAARAGELVRRCLTDDRERERRADLVEYYLGGADPDAALTRFLDACDDVIRERDAAQVRLAQAGA